jgi:hypothetical protein
MMKDEEDEKPEDGWDNLVDLSLFEVERELLHIELDELLDRRTKAEADLTREYEFNLSDKELDLSFELFDNFLALFKKAVGPILTNRILRVEYAEDRNGLMRLLQLFSNFVANDEAISTRLPYGISEKSTVKFFHALQDLKLGKVQPIFSPDNNSGSKLTVYEAGLKLEAICWVTYLSCRIGVVEGRNVVADCFGVSPNSLKSVNWEKQCRRALQATVVDYKLWHAKQDGNRAWPKGRNSNATPVYAAEYLWREKKNIHRLDWEDLLKADGLWFRYSILNDKSAGEVLSENWMA